MAEGLNKVILIGTLGFDPDYRVTPGGQPLATLRMVTNESYFDKKSNQRAESTEWHRVVVWGKQADVVKQYLSKGRQVYVEGRLRSHQWEKDGQKRTTTEIVAQRILFLGGRGEGGAPREDRAGYRGADPASAAASQARDSGPDSVERPSQPEEAFKEFSDGFNDDDVPF